MNRRKLFKTFLVAFWLFLLGCIASRENQDSAPLIIQEQGSFAVGGTVVINPGTFDPYKPTPAGQTFHGDHAYVFYQVPVKARKFPLVMWHGIGQFSKTWETTPDGREGFQNIFLRRRFSVYILDQPRRGDAGRSTVAATIMPTPDEQQWFGTFRLGVWPNFFEGVQFSRDTNTLNQYFRSMTPNIGPIDPSPNPGADGWRVRLAMARLWRNAVNRHGGDVTVVHLPEIGIKGNTHFPFSDFNNLQIADLMSKFLKDKRLD